MSKTYNQKIKLLLLMDILNECTDINHAITMRDILAGMEAEGIRAARKGIYNTGRTEASCGCSSGIQVYYRKEVQNAD